MSYSWAYNERQHHDQRRGSIARHLVDNLIGGLQPSLPTA
jgi:hypothetical protein